MPIYITPQEAVKAVKSHDHVHISSAAQLPYCLLSALEERADAGEITDIHFHHSYSDGPAPFDAEKYKYIFFDQAFFVGPSVRASGVVTPRADIQWVVTEYGAVNLLGKSLQERAKLLISIAHPDDRELLEKASFERFGTHFLYI